MEDNLEQELAASIEEDMAVKAMAQKLAPRDFAQGQAVVSMQKRSMVPSEHFQESLGSLEKTLADLQSLRNKLIGDGSAKLNQSSNATASIRKADMAQKPVVTMLHEQATDVARLAGEMAAVIAQIRERL